MKKIFLTLIGLIAFTACSDSFTDLAPVSNRNEADFYKNSDDFISAINSSYRGLLANGVYGRAYWTMFEMRGDNSDQGPDQTGLASQFTEINSFTENALNEYVESVWSSSYRVIANNNVILSRIAPIEMDATLKNRIIGEALFIRSLMYYHLAVAFENIPLQTVPFSPGDKLSQVSSTEVYDQLIVDLIIAEANLGESYTGFDRGRATKGAAATLLAKVYLTVGMDSEAEVVLRRIMNTYNYRLLNDYSNLWGQDNENNAESIFEVQFISGGIGQGSSFTNDFSPSATLQTGQGFGRNRPTASMKDAYEVDDKRFESSMGSSWINLAGNTITQNYIQKYFSSPPLENDSDINFVVFRYADVLLMLAEAIGESNESYGFINQVRNRAGLADIDETTAGSFNEKLLKERRVELAFENHRFADLKRFGVLEEKILESEPFISSSRIRSFFLIPQRELDINTNFVQNN
jgi:hypothetical protein